MEIRKVENEGKEVKQEPIEDTFEEKESNVKEEDHFDSDEMNLKNGQKSQHVEDVSSRIKGLSTPGDHEEEVFEFDETDSMEPSKKNRRYACCYCGEPMYSRQLTSVTLKPDILKQWGQILGQEFYKKASESRKSLICRSHFDVTWQKQRPENVLPIADLGKNPISKKQSNKSSQASRRYHGMSYTCIHCGESKMYCEMTSVTHNKFYLKQWGDILGEEFYKNAIAKGFSSSYICRSHFDVEWDVRRPHGILPSAISDRKQFEVGHIEEKARGRRTCAYCEEVCDVSDMTVVTQNTDLLLQWIEILGPKFAENVKSISKPYICRRHFDVKWGWLRPSTLIPCVKSDQLLHDQVKKEIHKGATSVKMMDPFKEVKQEEPGTDVSSASEFLECCYCKNRNILENMALVPRDKQGLTRWMNILGVEFYQNVMKNKHSYICRTHFNEQWKSEKTPKNVLPVKNVEAVNVLFGEVKQEIPQSFISGGDSSLCKQVKLEASDSNDSYQNLDSPFSDFTIRRDSGPKRIKLDVKQEE